MVFIITVIICYFVFKFESIYASVLLGLAIVIIVYYSLKREVYYLRIITLSICSSLLLNIVLNTHFYPSLLKYQGGSTMAQTVKKNKVPVDNIYKLSSHHTWALDFYNQEPVKIISFDEIKNKSEFWIYANDMQLRELQNMGFDWDHQYTEDQFRITRLQKKFLDPTTRKKVLHKMHLIHIN